MNDDLQAKTGEVFAYAENSVNLKMAIKKLEEQSTQSEENVMMLDSIVENKSRRVSELEEIVMKGTHF